MALIRFNGFKLSSFDHIHKFLNNWFNLSLFDHIHKFLKNFQLGDSTCTIACSINLIIFDHCVSIFFITDLMKIKFIMKTTDLTTFNFCQVTFTLVYPKQLSTPSPWFAKFLYHWLENVCFNDLKMLTLVIISVLYIFSNPIKYFEWLIQHIFPHWHDEYSFYFQLHQLWNLLFTRLKGFDLVKFPVNLIL